MAPEESKHEARSDEDEGERLDRELIELLNELRVVMPGVQVLFGFLLTVPFQQRFADVSAFQRDVYFVTLVLTAASGYAIFNVATTVETQEALSFVMGMAVSGIIYVNGYSLMQRAVRAKIAGRASGLFVCVFYMSAAFSGYIFAQLKGAYGWGDGALIIETLQMGIGVVALLFLDISKTSANKTSANLSDLKQPLVKNKVREA